MEPQKLASQLRCPSGEQASEIALGMNQANASLNKKCIKLLSPTNNESVLEIGPGNGAFVQDIINEAEGITYKGLDWSDEMVSQAEQLNKILVALRCAQFQQGNSNLLPFENASFDKVLTIHTLYFWDKPKEHLAEIRRVIKPSGTVCIAFGNSEFMRDLPFVSYGFELYDEQTVIKLLNSVGFLNIKTYQHHERGLSNTGDMVNKIINIITCEV